MGYQEWDDLGEKIQDIIDSAINEQNYRKLSQTVSQAVNKAIDTGGDAIKDALNSAFENKTNPEHNARAYETNKKHGYQEPPFGKGQQIVYETKKKNGLSLYGKMGGQQAKGVLLTTFGGIGLGASAVTCLVTGIMTLAGVEALTAASVISLAFTAGFSLVLGNGCRNLGRVSRFKRYVKELGSHTYCNLEQLSRAIRKPVKYVKKDIKAMIEKGWFLEGHVDKQETCLITSNETYKQYVETQKQLEERTKAAAAASEEAKKSQPPKEVLEVLERGRDFVKKIRESNDAIPGEEISRKISRMELIVEKIFDRARTHPEIIPELNRLMDYYLPLTVKLLNAYEDMDRQPIQGETITASKKEIEETIDTLNVAFEKILDSVFQDAAWDVSSDISVLQTVLAQEGLAEDDFTKMRREAAKKENI